MQVHEIMTPQDFSLHSGATLLEALEAVRIHGCSVLPVTADDRLIGAVTLASIQSTAAEAGLAAGSLPVEQAMERNPTYCYADEDIVEAEDDVQQDRPFLIVVDRDKRVVGTVATQDLCTEIGRMRGPVTGSLGSAYPDVAFDEDRVEYQSEESFPASDPPPGSSAQ
ncbi:MAG TPA: CBS domain-containing protein [Chloroflexota bacterium]